jgi:hypothetical protein
MAGGIDWFRWHHGSVVDPKFQLVARKAGARFGDVIAIWAFVLEKASADTDRGTIGELDFETIDFMLGAEDGTTVRILDAMTGRGLIVGNRIAAWEKRQPKREREEDPTAAERKRQQRAREATQDNVTPCHATSRQDTPREEERREEKSSTNPNGLVVGSDADRPDCPHQQIIALYHEVLPMCPRVRDWTPARATQLRARWNEDAKRQSLDWWRSFFEYVGASEFLTGRKVSPGKEPFFADLEWITKSANFTKIREGKYENRRAA